MKDIITEMLPFLALFPFRRDTEDPQLGMVSIDPMSGLDGAEGTAPETETTYVGLYILMRLKLTENLSTW